MTELLKEVKLYGTAHGLPVLRDAEKELLQKIVKNASPRRVLEIGTCIAYSTLLIMECLPSNAYITTIELDADRHKIAEKHIAASPFRGRIKALHGDAASVLPHLDGPWDFVFLDGPKGQYSRQLELLMPKLAPRAVIVADNVRYHDMVYVQGHLPHKHRTAVTRLHEFMDKINDTDLFETVVFENGDGLTVSRRKG